MASPDQTELAGVDLRSEVERVREEHYALQEQVRELARASDQSITKLSVGLRRIQQTLSAMHRDMDTQVAELFARSSELRTQAGAPKRARNDELSPPDVSVSALLSADGAAFVDRVFRLILGRAPEAAAVEFYTRELANGKPKLQMILEVRTSEEGRRRGVFVHGFDELNMLLVDPAETVEALVSKDGVEFIVCAYRTVLGRPPDETGLRFYEERLNKGVSKHEIIAELRRSDEGKSRALACAGLDARIEAYAQAKRPRWWRPKAIVWDGEGSQPVEIRSRRLAAALHQTNQALAASVLNHRENLTVARAELAQMRAQVDEFKRAIDAGGNVILPAGSGGIIATSALNMPIDLHGRDAAEAIAHFGAQVAQSSEALLLNTNK